MPGKWDSAWLTNMGEYHETLKEKLKTYLKTPNLELFVNGHMALELTLEADNFHGRIPAELLQPTLTYMASVARYLADATERKKQARKDAGSPEGSRL